MARIGIGSAGGRAAARPRFADSRRRAHLPAGDLDAELAADGHG